MMLLIMRREQSRSVKYLFVHQNFPGQFLHLVRHLLKQKRHDVTFISEPNENRMPGVRRVSYQATPPTEVTHPNARDFHYAMSRAEAVAQAARQLKGLGYQPDIIIGHHGWGELLNLPDVWSGVPILGYYEFFYSLQGQDVGFDPEFPLSDDAYANVRAKNAVNLLALINPGHGQTPTRFQLETHPAWAQPAITILEEGVDLAVCRPAATARQTTIGNIPLRLRDKLVTFVTRDLEPYRGFHIMMRALPRLMRERPDAKIVLVGGDGVSYGARLMGQTWRDYMVREVGGQIDLDRVYFPGRIPYTDYVQLLQRSDAHVYLTYPFVASWSLREALACGCAIVASDTDPVREFIIHAKTGVLTPFFDPDALAGRIAEMLDDGPAVRRMRIAARRWAETHLSMETYIAGYERLIGQIAASSL